MADTSDKATRSRVMARIKGSGNLTTEARLRAYMARGGLNGWQVQPKGVFGNPDFAFRMARLAVFVDGCFWHSCPRCGRVPKSNRAYWTRKLERNSARRGLVNKELRRRGWRVVRIWEHQIRERPLAAVALVRRGLASRGQSPEL